MTNKEIREAIENNPGGTDLEIALAIGSDEESVKRVRAAIAKEKEKEDELKRLEKENAEKAAKLAAEKRQAEEAKVRAVNKEDPGHDPAKEKCGPPVFAGKKRFWFRQVSGASIELFLVEETDRCVIFEDMTQPAAEPQ